MEGAGAPRRARQPTAHRCALARRAKNRCWPERLAACADDWSGSSRSIWSQSLSALGALEVVERCRRDTVVLSDR